MVIVQHFLWPEWRTAGYTFLATAILGAGGRADFLLDWAGGGMIWARGRMEQVQGRPLYIVDELVGFGETKAVGGADGGLICEKPGAGSP